MDKTTTPTNKGNCCMCGNPADKFTTYTVGTGWVKQFFCKDHNKEAYGKILGIVMPPVEYEMLFGEPPAKEGNT